jgi:hypothetical protein
MPESQCVALTDRANPMGSTTFPLDVCSSLSASTFPFVCE